MKKKTDNPRRDFLTHYVRVRTVRSKQVSSFFENVRRRQLEDCKQINVT